MIIYDYDGLLDPDTTTDEAWLATGDSGAPSFVVWNGELALVGVHWFKLTLADDGLDGSGDTLVSAYISDLEAAMVGEGVTTVPEPGSIALGLLACAALFTRRRRAA